MYFVQDPPRQRKFTIEGIFETSFREMDLIYVFGDIGHIRRLNGWKDNEVSGFEIFIERFRDIDLMTYIVRDAIGYQLAEDDEKLKVTNIRIRYPQILDWLNFQNTNVVVIIVLMVIVAAFNMISGLLILILEKTNMIGILKALGSDNRLIQRVFINQAAWLISIGLLWGNLIGIGLAVLQKKFSIISLNPESYYLTTVPINLDLFQILALNAGTMALIILALLLPSRLVSRIDPVSAIRYE
jgi:lipoprotein-releasing system permease protein